jgi:hypothetical protein
MFGSRHVSAFGYSAARVPRAGHGGATTGCLGRAGAHPGIRRGCPSAGQRPSQHEPTALREQNLIDVWIACADLLCLWATSNSTGPRQHVSKSVSSRPSRVRGGCQDAVRRAATARQHRGCGSVHERCAACAGGDGGPRPRVRGFVWLRDEPFSLCDAVQEVWSGDLYASHAGVQALEHVCVW